MLNEENQYRKQVPYKERYHQESLFKKWRKNEVLSLLLDSSLIFQTNHKFVNVKLIDCGDYKQVYYNNSFSKKNDKNLTKLKDPHSLTLKTSGAVNEKNKTDIELKQIELKNINRSKFEMQRLVKCNEKDFHTFITLTFADNIQTVEEANKYYNIWRTYIKRIKPDFKCVGVPEFQKRGAVHYHMLTNIEYNDYSILSQEERKIYNKKSGWQIGRDVKGWKYGHSMAKNMQDINVIGYLSKYMTKDIDNRLWGKRRYFYTQNINKPIIYELNLKKIEDFQTFTRLLTSDFIIEYQTNYINFLGDDLVFKEYKRNEVLE